MGNFFDIQLLMSPVKVKIDLERRYDVDYFLVVFWNVGGFDYDFDH